MAKTPSDLRKAENRRREGSEFLSTFYVANLLGISRWTLVDWRRKKKGPGFIKLGRNTVRYPRPELKVWLDSLPGN